MALYESGDRKQCAGPCGQIKSKNEFGNVAVRVGQMPRKHRLCNFCREQAQLKTQGSKQDKAMAKSNAENPNKRKYVKHRGEWYGRD